MSNLNGFYNTRSTESALHFRGLNVSAAEYLNVAQHLHE